MSTKPATCMSTENSVTTEPSVSTKPATCMSSEHYVLRLLTCSSTLELTLFSLSLSLPSLSPLSLSTSVSNPILVSLEREGERIVFVSVVPFGMVLL